MLVGVTPGATEVEAEVAKVALGIGLGARSVTDLTTVADDGLLRRLLSKDIAVGTVPTYRLRPAIHDARVDPTRLLLDTLESQAALGCDFFSIHPSLDRELYEGVAMSQRVIPITSRGGAMIGQLIRTRRVENPYLERFDEILALASEYDITLSFVCSLRPGSIADVCSGLYARELDRVAHLARRAADAHVDTIVELMNHVPLAAIGERIQVGREQFPRSGIGALGPTPTDIAVGLDDVAGAVGAAAATAADVDWINVVTAGEHSHLPSIEETERALRVFKLAIHIGAIPTSGVSAPDLELSKARAQNDWQSMAALAIDPGLARAIFDEHGNETGRPCSMCGPTCPLVKHRRLAAHRALAG
jgi:phosphomethylpyrimidine synthase